MPENLIPYKDKWKMFCLSKYYAHKNLEILVELFSRFREELEEVVAIITIDSNDHPNASRLLRSIEKHRLSKKIINVGSIPHHNVGSYYRHCQAFLMPTLMETFGIPYLEAMSFNLPVLTSDLDFAHSVCGDAALYFDPWNSKSIRDAILLLKNNPLLSNVLVRKGQSRLKMFKSWDQIAGEISELLSEIAVKRA
ncbi:MAG: glycosyltransferase [Acidobacteriota bacterium]